MQVTAWLPVTGSNNRGAVAPRRRGRKSIRNRTMDLTAHRNADWEDETQRRRFSYWLFQLDDEPNLYIKKWLEITISIH